MCVLAAEMPDSSTFHSLQRKAFMYLNDPAQTLEASFQVNYKNGVYAVYTRSGNMKYSKCDNVGRRQSSCLCKEPITGDDGTKTAGGNEADGH